MTAGSPIFLVSACTSGEEFVAAFRRYADKTGLFIPMQEPLAAGRRARFALTLRDGGVMIEGEAEVLSSARTASVLYGRVGMTVRFVEPDEPSKVVIGELEKARLAMKPLPPSVPPRPAEVPAEPRPVPPAPAGRVDAVNALAECVAIGDPEPGALAPAASVPPKAGPKFVVPSLGAPRGKTGSQAPLPKPDPAKSTLPGPAIPTPPRRSATTSSMPPLAAPAPPTTPTDIAAVPTGYSETMTAVAPPIDAAPSPRERVASTTMTAVPRAHSASAAGGLSSASGPTAIGAPIIEPSEPIGRPTRDDPTVRTEPAPPIEPTTLRGPGTPALAPPRAIPSGTTPPRATPATPLPITRLPAQPAPRLSPSRTGQTGAMPPIAPPVTPPLSAPKATGAMPPLVPAPPVVAARPPVPVLDADEDLAEPTDLTEIPVPEAPSRGTREPRRTVLGVAVVPNGSVVLPASFGVKPSVEIPAVEPDVDSAPIAADAPDTEAMPAQVVVEEPTPSGDWTMAPGASGPTIVPNRPAKPVSPPTGDWVIALDSSAPDGWTEPAKVEKVVVDLPPPPGPPVSAVAGERALDSAPKPEPVASAGPKVQIDSTLIEPPMPLAIEIYEPATLPPGSTLPPALRPPFTESIPAAANIELPTAGQPLPPGMAAYQPALSTLPGLAPMPLPLPAGASGLPTVSMGAIPGGTLPPSNVLVPPNMNTPLPRTPSPVGPSAMPLAYAAPHRPTTDSPVDDVRFTGDLTAQVTPAKSKRLPLILVGLGVAIAAALVAVIVLVRGSGAPAGGGGSGSAAAGGAKGSDATVRVAVPVLDAAPAIDAKVAEVASTDDAAPDPAPGSASAPGSGTSTPPSPSEDCFVDVASVPAGADIIANDQSIGTAPARVKLPCGAKIEITLKKARFSSTSRTVTPTPAGAKLRAALGKPTFSVKVTSTPTGATILSNGKSLGVTPATVKLPAYEASTVTLQKEGYTSDSQKITPKANNMAIHSTLKRRGR